MDKLLDALRQIIDRDGLNCLNTDAYRIYCELLETKAADEKTARLILMTLLAGVQKQKMQDAAALSAYIQENCCFSEAVSEELAGFYLSLFSRENRAAWRKNTNKGFREFCARAWHFDLESYETWHSRGGSVDASCRASVDLTVDDAAKLKGKLSQQLKKNPFLSADAIYGWLGRALQEDLDEDFSDYVTVEDYYPPVAEDYGGNFQDLISAFCEEYGLTLLSYDCDGNTSDFYSDYDD